MVLRKYATADCGELVRLFYETVHTINVADYTKEQLDAWAPENVDLEEWDRSFREHDCVIAAEDGTITGFGDMDRNGYFDRLYVHKDYQKRGVATAICDRLERTAQGKIITHASITAKSFFEKRGYRVMRKQQVFRRGIVLVNFVMEKDI